MLIRFIKPLQFMPILIFYRTESLQHDLLVLLLFKINADKDDQRNGIFLIAFERLKYLILLVLFSKNLIM